MTEQLDNLDIQLEALDTAQRMKLKRAFKKSKAKRAASKKRNAKKLADKDKLQGKSNKKARKIVEKKLLKGKDKSELSFAARQQLEKKVDKKKSAIKRIAKKELKTVRKDDRERVKKARSTKKEEIEYTEGVGLNFKGRRDFEKQVKTMGYKIHIPVTDPDGNVNLDQHYQVVKDKQGNHKGEWNNKSGYIAESIYDLHKRS